MTIAEKEEQARLARCLERIDVNLDLIGSRLHDYAREIRESTQYMWEARRDLDHIDKVAMRQSIEQKSRSADVLGQQREKLAKLRRAPYFGRVDFSRKDREANGARSIYIGVHDFRDEETGVAIVFDWRAPVSSMFYDHEIGPAHYQAPSGTVSGRIELKRQFSIREGRMEFMFDSSVNVVDDVLKRELGRSSDEGMKNIVATIQRDQNAIIRNGDAHTLIIQGVAGSGKTSIALHRIAFLLYRFKDTLSAEDILIISPNRVFSNYIANVLPELGEEQVNEIGMERLADELLQGAVQFQTFFEQTTVLLEKDDEALKARIRIKASIDFLTQIDAYAAHLEEGSFNAEDWSLGRCIVPKWFFVETWRKYRNEPFNERLRQVVDTAVHKIWIHYKRELRTDERRSLRAAIRAMAKRTPLKTAYKDLFSWMGAPEIYKPKGAKLEYADVFPFIYLKMKLEGVDNRRKDVKHLLIDEMQDYTPVQYAVIDKLFSCRKTVLGDASQSISPDGSSTGDDIRKILRAPPPVKLTRSYRSTWEIMQFALHVSPNAELIPMPRHGDEPKVVSLRTDSQVIAALVAEVEDFTAGEHTSLAIICRTQKQADKIASALTEKGVKVRLLDQDSLAYSNGIMVCTAQLAKGLEFDRVIVADANEKNYRTEMDRSLLYVACTRAMHRLAVYAVGTPSGFLPVGR